MTRHLGKILLGTALSATLGVAQAQFPEKPINYIIPFGPGGESDISARMQQPFFQELTGQDLVIQYKPGGGGAVGWAQLNSLGGDGYTIMGTNLPHIIMQPMQKDVGYTTDELTNFHFFHYTPDAIVVTADSPFQSLQDLIDAAKAAPGTVTFSGSGTYSANHIAKERFDALADIRTTYIPFGGTGPSVTALLGDQVAAAWGYTTVGSAQGDRVRLLAVAMEERHPAFPDVPTFKELGYDLVSGAYRGMAVPDSTPEEIRRQLSDLFAQVNRNPEFRQRMLDNGFAMIDIPYDEVGDFLAERQAEYQAIADSMGLE